MQYKIHDFQITRETQLTLTANYIMNRKKITTECMSSWEKKSSIEAAPLHGEQIEGDPRGSGGGGGGVWGLDSRLRGGGGTSEAGDR